MIFIFYFIIFHNEPTNAQLFHKLSHYSYMFRHYRVILRELVNNTLPSYTSMSNAVVGYTINNNNNNNNNNIFNCKWTVTRWQ